MQHVTYLAANDLVIKCESGDVEFRKGSLIDLCHDEDNNVWISYHEEANDKVHAFEIEINDKDVFSSILKNTVLVEEELDSKVSYEEMTIDRLLIDENIDMAQLLQYMVEANFSKNIYEGNRAKIPVRRVKKEMTPKQKAAYMTRTVVSERNPEANIRKAKSVKISKAIGESNGFFIDNSLLFNNDKAVIAKQVQEALDAYFGDKAKIKLSKENKIKVSLFKADGEDLVEALESLNINYIIEGTEDYKVVSLFKPQARQVVESYYTEKKEMDDDEMDDEEDLEEKLALMKKEYDDMDDGEEKEKLGAKIKELKAACGK